MHGIVKTANKRIQITQAQARWKAIRSGIRIIRPITAEIAYTSPRNFLFLSLFLKHFMRPITGAFEQFSNVRYENMTPKIRQRKNSTMGMNMKRRSSCTF